ncbi:hypothetical protein [Nocardia rhizosphaerihabitans]|nr:hypothetical protein [Nocardia rhizosphaerihabitans]
MVELYTTAGLSYMKLSGRPGVTASSNTINDWIHGKSFPQWGNLSPVLRAWGITDDDLTAWKDAHKRADKDARLRPGLPLEDVRDAYALEVHVPITVTAADDAAMALPPYVRRAHDNRLAEVVERALAGSSGTAVLLADSSTGKTRALWEALEPLRARGGWWLWHPSPHRPEELREQLDRVGPRTVVWLNETQRYFSPLDEQARGRLAEHLQTVLTNTRRAPILVLGSLWREHYRTLCSDGTSSATRALLEPATVTLPENFAGADMDAMRAAAGQDPRLKMAVDRAENGTIAQYLAGGPELVHYYDKQASAPERAVIEAAIDLVRMGHPNALPFALLHDIAAGYIDDITWDTLDDNWFEAALTETGRKRRGARGAVTPIGARPLDSRASQARGSRGHGRRFTAGPGQPTYQLADFLDQHGRRTRSQKTPPWMFWDAAAVHADPDHQHILARSGWDRGLYREAAQLWKNATSRGHSAAASSLVTELFPLFPAEHHPLNWAITHITLDDPHGVADLLEKLQQSGADIQALALADRAAAHIALDEPDELGLLLERLQRLGLDAQVLVLADRAAAHIALDNPSAVASLLAWMKVVGADVQALTLADRAAAHTALDHPHEAALLPEQLRQDNLRAMADLLEQLQHSGADIPALADHAATHVVLDNPRGVAFLLGQLHVSKAHGQALALADRAAAHVALDKPGEVAYLLEFMRLSGADVQALTLADRAAAHVALDRPSEVALLLRQLLDSGADVQALTLANRAVHIALDHPRGLSDLLEQMRRSEAHSQALTLAGRAAAHVALDSAREVASLLEQLRQMGADVQALTLADRAAAHVALDHPSEVALLLRQLLQSGANAQALALTDRAAVHIALDNPAGLAFLLDKLHAYGAHVQAKALAGRLPAVGMYSLFIEYAPYLDKRFMFGREPDDDLTPAEAWSWTDLE